MDDFLLRGARKALVQLLENKGITDENVLNAFAVVERHLFIESFLWNKAYEDQPLPIACKQTISQPFTVAFQSQLLGVKKGDKVLEIGTGSGFQAAILNAMGAKVYSVERQAELYTKAKATLDKLAPQVVLAYGDGFNGLPRYAPFDKIIVTCGAPNVPPALLQQLKINGQMVIPVGQGAQTMKRLTKLEDESYKEETYGNFVFVPMLENIVRTQ